jgi:hypothetical protein
VRWRGTTACRPAATASSGCRAFARSRLGPWSGPRPEPRKGRVFERSKRRAAPPEAPTVDLWHSPTLDSTGPVVLLPVVPEPKLAALIGVPMEQRSAVNQESLPPHDAACQ